MLKKEKKIEFKKTVWKYYKKYGRHDLAWRHTVDPYKVLVSEIMLQQTQVSRVLEKYPLFLKTFPTFTALAKSPLSKVITTWSGLGYNRRAKNLHALSRIVVYELGGRLPTSEKELRQLPGIGSYTAGIIMAFAYDIPSVVIETNIRTVYLHHFFAKKKLVSDTQLLSIIASTLDQKHPREWYWALMDYGSHLKSDGVKAHRNSKVYKKQSTFKGSRREVRGKLIKLLLDGPLTLTQVLDKSNIKKEMILPVLLVLINEGFIVKERGKYRLATV